MGDGYPSDWDQRRKTVYQRDNYQCQNCGRHGGPQGNAELHAHHIVPKSKGGTHQLTNLKTMCSNCHNAIHGRDFAPTATHRSKQRTSNRSQDNSIRHQGALGLLIFLVIWVIAGLVASSVTGHPEELGIVFYLILFTTIILEFGVVSGDST